MWGVTDSPYGACFLEWNSRNAIKKLYFSSNYHNMAIDERDDKHARLLAEAIFWSGEKPDIELVGSELEMAVWTELLTIERGERRTYSQIARAIGRERAVRAVASAIGRNEVSYLVPCHRVVRSDRSLGGYRWGLDVKKALLDDESR